MPGRSSTRGKAGLLIAGTVFTIVAVQIDAQTFIDKHKIGKHLFNKQEPVKPHYHGQNPPCNMVQLANVIDILEEGLRDDGIVALQQPSVWGQARMTLYRNDFEKEMRRDLDKFDLVLSARIARSDQASFESLTALQGSLGKGTSTVTTNNNFTLTPTLTSLDKDATLSLLDKAFKSVGQTGGKLGLEPPVYLDEKKRYLEHLNQIRRINMGDDNSDSAGYGLYLVRLPVSITPGEKTRENHGAQLSVTAQHVFGPDFMAMTFRNLVINDVIDQLTPVIYETRLHDLDLKFFADVKKAEEEANAEPKKTGAKKLRGVNEPELLDAPKEMKGEPKPIQTPRPDRPTQFNLFSAQKALADGNFLEAANRLVSDKSQKPHAIVRLRTAASPGRLNPVAPTDVLDVFRHIDIALLSLAYKDFQDSRLPRAIEIRAFLRREIETAFDIMERGIDGPAPLTDPAFFHRICDDFRNRRYPTNPKGEYVYSKWFDGAYDDLKVRLQNRVANTPLGALCWAIAVETALLNQQLQEDIRKLVVQGDLRCTGPVEALAFHLPYSMHETQPYFTASEVFQDYVRVRWPLVTFHIDPVVDQQNIADAYSMRREMRLAVAIAFSTGKIGFNQMTSYMRRVEMDAETIALNRTVTGYAHGNDTFGWRFCPRYQNPPPERSNIHTLGNLIWRGGPGRDYALRNARLEPGQRELTAVIVMPSFLNKIRFDVTANWFRLTNPDDMRISTGRMIEYGRHVKELQEASAVCDITRYRPDDYHRLRVRMQQLEKMLPMQTHIAPIPYECNLGGFELFGQGNEALTPKLIGFAGLDELDIGSATADKDSHYCVMLYGKNFSLQETKAVVGGRCLCPEPEKCPPLEILSREVAKLTIPKNALTMLEFPEKDHKFVEVNLATPNGISNKLLIPVAYTPTKPAPAAFVLNEKTTKVHFRACWATKPPCALQYEPDHGVKGQGAQPAQIVFDWKVANQNLPAGSLVEFKFKTDKGDVVVVVPGDSDIQRKALIVDSSKFAQEFLLKLGATDRYCVRDVLPTQFTGSIAVIAADPNLPISTRVELAETLTVDLGQSACCAPPKK